MKNINKSDFKENTCHKDVHQINKTTDATITAHTHLYHRNKQIQHTHSDVVVATILFRLIMKPKHMYFPINSEATAEQHS